MLRQIRALFRTESPLPAHLHYHVGDDGRPFLCGESICRPVRRPPVLPLPPRW